MENFSRLNIFFRHLVYKTHKYRFSSGSDEMKNMLKASQPTSILDVENKILHAYGMNVYIYKLAIICPNFFQYFITPHLVQEYSYYPSKAVAQDWQSLFPSAHLFPLKISDKLSNDNLSPSDAFSCLNVILSSSRYSFCIKHHRDADNYWHWTFDWLPRLLALRKLIDDEGSHINLKNIDFYSYGSLNKFQDEWIKLLFPETLSIKKLNRPTQFYNHISCNQTFTSHHNTEIINDLRKLMTSAAVINRFGSNKNVSSSRIYILRGKSLNGRNITNEEELIARVENLGFVALAMDRFSVHEQASIFNSAEIIIGAHGSAFVNMIYCKPSTQIIELFGPGYTSMHDYILAHQCKLNWDYILGSSEKSANFTSDYCVPVQQLINKLT